MSGCSCPENRVPFPIPAWPLTTAPRPPSPTFNYVHLPLPIPRQDLQLGQRAAGVS